MAGQFREKSMGGPLVVQLLIASALLILPQLVLANGSELYLIEPLFSPAELEEMYPLSATLDEMTSEQLDQHEADKRQRIMDRRNQMQKELRDLVRQFHLSVKIGANGQYALLLLDSSIDTDRDVLSRLAKASCCLTSKVESILHQDNRSLVTPGELKSDTKSQTPESTLGHDFRNLTPNRLFVNDDLERLTQLNASLQVLYLNSMSTQPTFTQQMDQVQALQIQHWLNQLAGLFDLIYQFNQDPGVDHFDSALQRRLESKMIDALQITLYLGQSAPLNGQRWTSLLSRLNYLGIYLIFHNQDYAPNIFKQILRSNFERWLFEESEHFRSISTLEREHLPLALNFLYLLATDEKVAREKMVNQLSEFYLGWANPRKMTLADRTEPASTLQAHSTRTTPLEFNGHQQDLNAIAERLLMQEWPSSPFLRRLSLAGFFMAGAEFLTATLPKITNEASRLSLASQARKFILRVRRLNRGAVRLLTKTATRQELMSRMDQLERLIEPIEANDHFQHSKTYCKEVF